LGCIVKVIIRKAPSLIPHYGTDMWGVEMKMWKDKGKDYRSGRNLEYGS
jgi:hypothetical protein